MKHSIRRSVKTSRAPRKSTFGRRRTFRFEALESRQLLAADIAGTVFNDINGDGVRDQGDDGLANWTVFLDLNQDGLLDTGDPSTITDADGKYVFSSVAAGDYRVAEIIRSGWTPTNSASGFIDVTAADNETVKADFLNQGSGGTGAITGTVWRDLNNNGIQDAEDTGVAGWTVFLDLNVDSVLDPDEPFELTDGNGDYTFTGILGGGEGDAIDYEVQQIRTLGWEPAPGFDENQTASVVEGQTTIMPDFANTPVSTSRVEGNVWSDVNGNGVRDGAEPGLSGWTVYADLNTNEMLDAGEPNAITDASGNYSIVGLEPGTHRIAEVQSINYRPTSPSTGYRTAVAPTDGTVSNVNFGNQLRTDASIGGVVYVDRDHDGVRDPGEEGLPGITVYLDDNNNGLLDVGEKSMSTGEDLFYTPDVDEAGTYRFDHLAGGTYFVRQIVPLELSSTPEVEIEHVVTVGPADDRSDVDSGDRYRPSEIHGFKFEDVNGNHVRDAGEPGIEGVTIFIDMNRNNIYDEATEPSTVTAADGSYSFIGLEADAYIVREIVPSGFLQTFPETVGGILWPAGDSNPAVGNVSPLLIQTSLETGATHTETVSLTLPTTGALTNMVDVFLLFDDTGSFTSNSPIVRAAFPNIIAQLQTQLPGIDLGFGVGRLEEYGNFAAEYSTGRPFILNQPIIAADVAGFSGSIQSALDHVAPGYGGDQPETVIEALYQMVTGAGFDGNNNGSVLDSGPAGLASTQLTPGNSGDVPSFASFTADPANGVLPASGTIGGAGFRSGALPIIITATDTGFAYQPKGEASITGIDGLTLPVSQLTGTSRGTTPYSSGAGIQETVTGLNALGALVIGLGTNDAASTAPRQGLEALASLTGAVNQTTTSIANGTADPIDPGDPFYFKIGAGGDPLVGNIADGIIAAIDGAVTSVNVNVTLRASDPRVHIAFNPGVINGLGAGETATFDVTFTGDGRPHRFDLQFVREGTDVVLGSIPVVLGTPVSGDGYEYEDCDDGEHSEGIDFGNQRIDGIVPNVAPSFTIGADQIVIEDSDAQTIANWATNISPGPASESTQFVDFLVNNNNTALFAKQPTVSADGTLTFTPAADAFGIATVTVQAHDNGGTAFGGIDTSAPQTFAIEVTAVNDAPIAADDAYSTDEDSPLTIAAAGVLSNDTDSDSSSLTAVLDVAPSNGSVTLNADGSFTYTPNANFNGTDSFTYHANDGALDSNSATVNITVNAVNDAPSGTKFFVIDQSRQTFEYDANGNSRRNTLLSRENAKPRGIAASPDGSTLWTVNADSEVFVYDADSQSLGLWEIKEVDKPEGVTVHGDDLWVVDRESDRVYYFAGGSVRRSGEAEPTSSFQLARGNRNPLDLVTDGTSVWVVNNTTATDKVFRYSLSGELEGSWLIDDTNAQPSGLTIDPNDIRHIWIVDAVSDRVYQYDGAVDRLSGSQAANSSFALDSANRNPQGIADPRPSADIGRPNVRFLPRDVIAAKSDRDSETAKNRYDFKTERFASFVSALRSPGHTHQVTSDGDIPGEKYAEPLEATIDQQRLWRDEVADFELTWLNESSKRPQTCLIDAVFEQLKDGERSLASYDFDDILREKASSESLAPRK